MDNFPALRDISKALTLENVHQRQIKVLVNHFLYCDGGEALEQVAQRSCGCPLPGSVQGQVGWGFGELDVVEGVPGHGRGVGTRSLRDL